LRNTAIPLSVNAAPFRSNSTTVLENSIVNALIGMLYHPEEQRLTQAELDERVELTRFENIIHPLNTTCSITHDEFEPSQQVARIRHCGHIFNSDSLAHWLRLNNTCPSCRHNLRDTQNANAVNVPNAATATATSTATANAANANVPNAATSNAVNVPNAATANANIINMRHILEIPLDSEINMNTFYNDLIRNSANIPGFELNSVEDDSIMFSFDLSDRRNGSGPAGQGPAGQGPAGQGPAGQGSGSGSGSGNIDEVD
jgi:hypothetical protein